MGGDAGDPLGDPGLFTFPSRDAFSSWEVQEGSGSRRSCDLDNVVFLQTILIVDQALYGACHIHCLMYWFYVTKA